MRLAAHRTHDSGIITPASSIRSVKGRLRVNYVGRMISSFRSIRAAGAGLRYRATTNMGRKFRRDGLTSRKAVIRSWLQTKGKVTVMALDDSFTLTNGVKIPKLGLDTWRVCDDEVGRTARAAIGLGHSHVDIA